MMESEQNLSEGKGKTSYSSGSLPNISPQRRQLIAGMLFWVTFILGMFLGFSLGGMIVLYFEGGLHLIQEVINQEDSHRMGSYLLVAGLSIGIILGATLSKYFWAWLVVKIGLLTEAEVKPSSTNSLH